MDQPIHIDIQVVVFGGDDAAFLIVLLNAHITVYLHRLLFGEDGSATVPFFNRVIGIHVIAFQIGQGLEYLVFLGLGFLQTQHIGVELFHGAIEVFFDRGAQAVYVPRVDTHREYFACKVLSREGGSKAKRNYTGMTCIDARKKPITLAWLQQRQRDLSREILHCLPPAHWLLLQSVLLHS